MIHYAFDLYPADDPKDGTRLVRFSHLQEASFRGEGNGTGSGRIAVRGTSPDAFYIDPGGLQYVRVVEIDDADAETVRGGFFLEEGDFDALTEDEHELLTFGGTGTLAYVQREVMWSHTYEPWGRDPFDKQWRLFNQSTVYAGGNYLGAILWRIFDEGLKYGVGPDGGPYDDDKPESAIPAITLTFDGFEDTDGNPWTIPGGEFKAQVGENLLDVTARLMQAGLYVELDPDTFELRAWETEAHRRDVTGTAWASDVVRFQAPTDDTIATGNIKDDLSRTIRANIRRTAILAGGDEDQWALATAVSGIPWHGGVPLNVNDVDAAQAVADNQLIARSDAGDNITLRIKLGNDPAAGRYVPWDHVRPLDTVTVHTGTGQWDANEAAYPVAAVTVKLRRGGDWDAYVELGATYSSLLEPAFNVAPPAAHSHILPFCTVDLPGGVTATLYEEWTWDPGNPTVTHPYVTPAAGVWGSGSTNSAIVTPPSGAEASLRWSNFSHDTGSAMVDCTAGDSYRFTGYFNASQYNFNGRILVRWYNAADALIQSDQIVYSAAWPRSWTLWSGDVTAPVGATHFNLVMYVGSSGTVGISGSIDQVRIYTLSGGTDGPGTDELTGSSMQVARCDHNHLHNDLLGRDAADTHAASAIGYDGSFSGSLADNVQDRLDELSAATAIIDITPGTVSTITSSSAFLNFPGVTRMADGRLLLVYRSGTDHATTQDGKIVGKIGTVGNDFSVTWGSQFDIYDDPSLDCRDPEVATLSDGTLIVSFFTWNGTTTYSVKTCRSTDNGATWETPVTVTTSFSGTKACSAKVVELPSGDLLLPIYGHNGSTPYIAAVVKSTDGGATWGSQVTIASGTIGAGNNWTEPYIVLLADGRLHCLIREDTDGVIYRSTSSDGGATWATPAIAYSGDARPAHIQTQSGGLLMVSRADPNGDTVWRTSSDYGVTWSDETVLDSAGTRNEYASIVQLDHYRYGVAYAIQNSSTDADVKWALFTDSANLDIIARLDAAVAASGGGGSPTGAAGGDLSGTYPNPSVVDDSHSHTAATLPAPGSGLSASGETVSTVNANQNDYNPTNLHTVDVLRFTSFSAARTITGLDAGTDGEMLIMVNNTGQNLVLAHENASSSANNRFRCPAAASVTVRAGGSVALLYINTRWSVIAI